MAMEPETDKPPVADVRDKPMPTEDKVLLAILAALAIGLLIGLRWIITALFDVSVGATAGIGFRDAFFYAIGLSIVLMIVFALVAGDGALGELTTMLIGFFIMVIFFTLSIALIL